MKITTIDIQKDWQSADPACLVSVDSIHSHSLPNRSVSKDKCVQIYSFLTNKNRAEISMPAAI